MKMVALKSFVYAGKRLQTGAEFKARSGSDARLLKAIRNADDAPPEPPPPPPAPSPAPRATYRSRAAVAAESAPAPEPIPMSTSDESGADEIPAEKPKRAYKRRDLVAEK